jgi:hypothetical protein
MTTAADPTEIYASRAAAFRETMRGLRRRADLVSHARLATFVLFIVFGLAAELRNDLFWIPAAVAAAAFVFLIRQHRQLRTQLGEVGARAALCDLGLARRARQWADLPVVVPGISTAHPYVHDLDLFGEYAVTQLCGPIRTHHGRRAMRTWLTAAGGYGEIADRQDAVRVLRDDIDLRESLAVHGAGLDAHGEARLRAFLTWVTLPPGMHVAPPLAVLVRVLPVVTVGLIAAQIAGVLSKPWWSIPLIISAVLALVTLRRISAEFDKAFDTKPASLQYSGVLAVAERAPNSTPLLQRIRERLRAGNRSASAAIERLEKIMTWSDARHSPGILSIVLEIVFLWSLQAFLSLQSWRRESKNHVAGWFDALGDLEALCSLATLAYDQPDWCFPALDPNATAIDATSLGHPMLSDGVRVHNDVKIGPEGTLLLVTGSNMSGKSTLLRAIGVNTVLAQAGAPVCAATYRAPILQLYTSINVRDSLTAGVSLYMAQLKRLKEVLDGAQSATPTQPCCYLLDEILSGTNSADRTVAVRAVLRQLLRRNAIGVVTTHDLAVAEDERIQEAALNVHFAETIDPDQGTMTFDYRVRPGPVERSNAFELMRMMGITDQFFLS